MIPCISTVLLPLTTFHLCLSMRCQRESLPLILERRPHDHRPAVNSGLGSNVRTARIIPVIRGVLINLSGSADLLCMYRLAQANATSCALPHFSLALSILIPHNSHLASINTPSSPHLIIWKAHPHPTPARAVARGGIGLETR